MRSICVGKNILKPHITPSVLANLLDIFWTWVPSWDFHRMLSLENLIRRHFLLFQNSSLFRVQYDLCFFIWNIMNFVLLTFSDSVYLHYPFLYISNFKVNLLKHRSKVHNDVIKWKHFPFPYYWPFVRGINRSRWIPHTNASDAELWCFLWSSPE